MTFTETKLAGVFIVHPTPMEDSRGAFFRTYCEEEFKQINHTARWVQANHSLTTKAGTIRGIHFQHEPFAEIKLIRCISGAVYDVIVDLRQNSPTFLQWLAVELSAANRLSIYIPKGMAHGFQTLTDNAAMTYLHSAVYNKESEGALRYDDPKINIEWKLPLTEISERDKNHPLLPTDFKGLLIK